MEIKVKKLFTKKSLTIIIGLLYSLFIVCGIFYTNAGLFKKGLAEANYITSAWITLNEDVVVNYEVAIPEGYTTAQMSFTFNSKSYQETKIEITDSTVVFSFDKVTPQYFDKTIVASLVLSGEGKTNIEETNQDFSIKSYVYSLLSKSKDELTQTDEQNTSMKKLLVDMLYYGQASMEYTNTNGISLIENLTEEQKGYKTVFTALNSSDYSQTGIASDKVSWQGAGLWFDYNVSLYYKFLVKTEITDLSLSITKGGKNENINNFSIESTLIEGEKIYTAIYTNISATEFDEIIEAQLFEGDVAIGKVAMYSVKSYIYSKQENSSVSLLAQATYNYGKSAENYLQSLNQQLPMLSFGSYIAQCQENAVTPVFQKELVSDRIFIANYPYIQGGCTDGTNYYFAFSDVNSNKVYLAKYDFERGLYQQSELFELTSSTKWEYDSGNIAYIKGNIILLNYDGSFSTFDPQTLQKKENEAITFDGLNGKIITSIVYNSKLNRYAVSAQELRWHPWAYLYIYDENMNLIAQDIKMVGTWGYPSRTLSANDDYIYSLFDREKQGKAGVQIYSWDGTLITEITLEGLNPTGTLDNITVQNMIEVDGAMYIGVYDNTSGKQGGYLYKYTYDTTIIK